jgi:hypothetical protein
LGKEDLAVAGRALTATFSPRFRHQAGFEETEKPDAKAPADSRWHGPVVRGGLRR